MPRRASLLISFLARRSMSSSIGTSFLIVARNFENSTFSRLARSFSLSLPLHSSMCSYIPSMLLNCCMSWVAVFSPTPGHPGILSAVSPIRPSMSITWEVSRMEYFSLISASPNKLNPPVPGLSCKVVGLTS